MSETIFLLNNDGGLVEMHEEGHLTEAAFQELLANYPKLISGEQIDKNDPRRWLLISREMGVADALNSSNRWSLDHLFIDQDGVPTLVEVKRGTDTRLRREVIGQILDYAANAVTYWSIEEIQLRFSNTCEKNGKNTDEELDNFLEENFFADKFWETVQSNLRQGKIRLLLVADIIPREMQRIIEFLNEQMSPCEILGVEIKQFVGQNLKTLVPRAIGATAQAEKQKTIQVRSQGQWNEDKYFAEVARLSPEHLSTYKDLYTRSKTLFDNIWWGSGNRTGNFIPHLNINGIFIQLYGVYTYGGIEIQFQWLKTKAPFNQNELRKELLLKFNDAITVNLGNFDKRPSIPVSALEKPGAIDLFFEVVQWYIKTMKEYYQIAP